MLFKKSFIMFLACFILKCGILQAQINTGNPEIPFGSNSSYEYGLLPTNMNVQDAQNAYNSWKSNFTSCCDGYCIVNTDGGAANIADVVSEGIAYGMLLAAYAGDKPLFDGLWKFYKESKTNCTGFMNWAVNLNGCRPGGIVEAGGAADADVDAAMALIVAARQWPNATNPYNYRVDAQQIVADLMDYQIDHISTPRYELSNGDGWLEYNPTNCTFNQPRSGSDACRNPSYQAPGYFQVFIDFLENEDPLWSQARDAGRNLWFGNAHQTTGLASNWCRPGGSTSGACAGSGTSTTGFGYDAIRTPWRQGVDAIWHGHTPTVNVIAKQVDWWNSRGGVNQIGDGYNYDGTGSRGNANSTFISMIAAQSLGLTNPTYQTWVNNMYQLNVSENTSGYFNQSLRTIGLFVQTGNFWNPARVGVCDVPRPDLDGDKSFCGVSSIILESGVPTGGGITFEWKRNGSTVAGPNTSATTFNATQAGTYEVIVTLDGCSASDQIQVVNELFEPDMGGIVQLCDAPTATLDAGPGVNYVWSKDGSPLGLTTRTIEVDDPGVYTVQVSAQGCTAVTGEVTVTVGFPVVEDVSICSAGEASLLATGIGPFSWYSAPSGGTALHTGNTYTPTITNNTTYYVQGNQYAGEYVMGPSELGNGEIWTVAEGDPDGGFEVEDKKLQIVVTHASLLFKSLDVFTFGPGLRDVVLNIRRQGNPAILKTVTKSVTAGRQTIEIDMYLETGTYILDAEGTQGMLQLRTSGSPAYPFTQAGVVSLPIYPSWKANEGTMASWSLFFDMTFDAGQQCARVPVNVDIDPEGEDCGPLCVEPADITITQGASVDLCPQESIDLTINTQANIADFDFRWYRGTYPGGTPVTPATDNVNTLGYTVEHGDGATYTVVVRDKNLPTEEACIKTASIVVNDLAAPTASITTSGSALTYCETESGVTLTAANAGTGATYQWIRGTVNQGTAGTTTSISDAVAGNWSVEVSKDGCIATSESVVVSTNPAVSPSVTISASNTAICQGEAVTFSVAASQHLGLSPEYSWRVNSVEQGIDETFLSSTLTNRDEISLSVTSNATCVDNPIAESNLIPITVSGSVEPTVTIAITSASNLCEGEVFTAEVTNSQGGGSTPSYVWRVNNQPSQQTGTEFSAVLSNGDLVSVELTSSSLCATVSSAVSNDLTVLYSDPVEPIVLISADQTTICAGEEVNFTIETADHLGANPTYSWLVNNTQQGQAATFSSSNLNDGDNVVLRATSSLTCVSSDVVESNVITLSTNEGANPAVSIVASATSICPGQSVEFSIQQSDNLGDSPTYRWEVNGELASTSATFITTSLANNDQVQLIVESSAACISNTSALSNIIDITTDGQVTASVSILASSTSICNDEEVTFSILDEINLGDTPTYSWLVNGEAQGAMATFATSTLANGDEVSLSVLSSEACVLDQEVVSNSIVISVSGSVDPQVTISTDQSTLCEGEVFTAMITNSQGGGSSPQYTWLVNGTASGQTGTSFSSETLSNGESVSVELTSSSTCATSSLVVSNEITVNYTSLLTPVVTISADRETLCNGEEVLYEIISSSNLGQDAVYTWLKNNVTAQTGLSYSTSSILSSDIVSLRVSNISGCVSNSTIESNGVSVSVNSTTTASVTISANNTTVCEGEEVVFTASNTTGIGTSAIYSWRVNGVEQATSTTFTTSNISNNDQVSLQVTSDLPCVSPATVTSNNITMTVVGSSTPTLSVSANNNPVCLSGSSRVTANLTNGGTTSTYQWFRNAQQLSLTSNSINVTNIQEGDEVYVVVTTSSSCSAESVVLTSDAIVFDITDSPEEPTIEGSTSLCARNSLTATYSVANNLGSRYSWTLSGPATFTGQGTSEIVVIFDSIITTVSINVLELGAGGCAGPSTSLNIALQVCTSVDGLVDSYKFLNIYPNPYSEYLTIDMSGVQDRIEFVEILDAKGMPVKQYTTPDVAIELRDDLPNGQYIIRIQGENNMITRKVVKMN